jgi:short-subunit dehydrogenase
MRTQRRLQDEVVVITGASSGIGRSAAMQFAAEGARVVLAARRADALEEAAAACRALGGTASVVVTDVTREDDLQRLVDLTLKRWTRIDVWINGAGTTFFAPLDEGDFAAHRRVLDVNLLGPMYAARLLVPVFRRQRAGTLINIGSVLSKIGQPFVPSYVVSKFGLEGLSEALRVDFADTPAVHVCTVLPYATDSAHFEEGANATGRRAHPMPPVQHPEQVAAAIVDLAVGPRRERYVPRYAAIGVAIHRLFPRTTARLVKHALTAFHLVAQEPPSDGTIYAPAANRGTVRGVRQPVISSGALAVWILGDLLTIGLERFSRRNRRWPMMQRTR